MDSMAFSHRQMTDDPQMMLLEMQRQHLLKQAERLIRDAERLAEIIQAHNGAQTAMIGQNQPMVA